MLWFALVLEGSKLKEEAGVLFVFDLRYQFFKLKDFRRVTCLSQRNGGEHVAESFPNFGLTSFISSLSLRVLLKFLQNGNSGDVLDVVCCQDAHTFPVMVLCTAFKNRFTEVGHEPLEKRPPLAGMFKKTRPIPPSLHAALVNIREGISAGKIPIDIDELEAMVDYCEEFAQRKG